MSTPNLTPSIEDQILTALKAKFEAVSGVSNVLIENPLFDSKQDAINKVCVQNVDNETEVKYIYLSFLGFQDSATDGCNDRPSVNLTYNAHCVWQYKEKRSDLSYSEKDFKALIFNLRNKFLNKNREILSGIETTPLVQNAFILLADDPLTGAYAYLLDFTLKVEID